jgi:hypothetical protein
MLKTNTYVLTSPAIDCYVYVGNTYCNAKSNQIAKDQRTHVETVFWYGLHLSSFVKQVHCMEADNEVRIIILWFINLKKIKIKKKIKIYIYIYRSAVIYFLYRYAFCKALSKAVKNFRHLSNL